MNSKGGYVFPKTRNHFVIILRWIVMLISVSVIPAGAQDLFSIAGDGFLMQATNGASPLATNAVYLFIPANVGNSYQIINIYRGSLSGGTYGYLSPEASPVSVGFNDSVAGSGSLQFDLTTQNFVLGLDAQPGSYQSGTFAFALHAAPASVAGRTFLLDGTEYIRVASSGNSYRSSSGTSGTYSYSLVNRCVGKMQINDALLGTFTAYFGFADALNGTYAASAASQFRIGRFELVDTNPPIVSITAPTNGQRYSNDTFVVTGKAGDNTQVAAVYYAVGPDWALATTTNAWTNWSATVTLSPGTNFIFAYAVDVAANQSAVVGSRIDDVVLAPIAIQTNGAGSISPFGNGALLELGRNYRLTAKPAAGFKFSNWTGSATTNGASLGFVMASNLSFTANFLDTNRPTLMVTNLSSGQRWSNSVMVVKGTAADNSLVALVQYRLNGGDWTKAVGTTRWAAPITPQPGTNVFQIHAVDGAGNCSATNNIAFQEVVPALLAVQMVGRGTLSPNYSNAWLEIGRNYSLTATPAAGFAFTNWWVTTDDDGTWMTNRPTVKFMMASNLSVQATFVDVTRPTLAVSAPVSGQKITNALATLRGSAKDNGQVTSVWCQLNGGAWSLASTTNQFTNWTATVTLLAGTNSIKAYALDAAGNASTTNTVNVFSTNSFKLQLAAVPASAVAINGLALNLQLSSGVSGRIEVSTDLVNWVTLTHFVSTNGTLNFADKAATNVLQRFYRAVIP